MTNRIVGCGPIMRSNVQYRYADNIQHYCLVMSVKVL